jgi:hypothetical protein
MPGLCAKKYGRSRGGREGKKRVDYKYSDILTVRLVAIKQKMSWSAQAGWIVRDDRYGGVLAIENGRLSGLARMFRRLAMRRRPSLPIARCSI